MYQFETKIKQSEQIKTKFIAVSCHEIMMCHKNMIENITYFKILKYILFHTHLYVCLLHLYIKSVFKFLYNVN